MLDSDLKSGGHSNRAFTTLEFISNVNSIYIYIIHNIITNILPLAGDNALLFRLTKFCKDLYKNSINHAFSKFNTRYTKS